MRIGGNYTFQQALTTESTTIVKQALNLAKRRGHSHVTPLHIASVMLVSSSGLLKKACLQLHSHPLQYKALELCFNVALNRLPTSVSSPVFEPHAQNPCLSNALVAAFKRAQAYQRRGSTENQQQQQPILALKVEIEQLVISILDDPSVSRVMREVGFSSIQLKTNIEQTISLNSCSKNGGVSTKPIVLGNTNYISQTTLGYQVRNDDVMSVIEAMINKKRKNIVILGECLATVEGVIKGVVDKFNKGEISLDMKHVQFISVPLFTLRNVSREEFEVKIGELRTLLRSYVNKGVVLYLGDLKWISEFWIKYSEQSNSTSYYSPVEHMIMELSRLLCGGIKENGRLWLMGIASFQTYMKCKTGCPSLQTLWDLHPLTIPVVTLDLSLNLESDLHSQFRSKTTADGSSWSVVRNGVKKQLTCCADCLANFNREAKSINIVKTESTTFYSSSSLPSWLQKYKEVNRQDNNNNQEAEEMRNLCKKWNSICNCVHKQYHNFLEKGCGTLSSLSSPCSSTSISSSNQSKKEHQFLDTKPELLSNPNSSPNSASSSEASGYNMDCLNRFKEFNSENMNIICKALEKKVPWQKDIIPDIVSTILQCRGKKEETWLFFLGADSEGKEKISRELAKIIFGSQDSFISIGLSSFSSSTLKADDSTEEVGNKRSRDEHGKSYLERFADAIQENPSRVFFMEDVDQVDSFSQKGIKKAIVNGSFTLPDGELVFVKDSIVIFSCDEYFSSSVSRPYSPPTTIQKSNGDVEEEKRENAASLDLNIAIHGDDIGILEAVDKQIMFNIQLL
ncbi:PREDICTED: protein SMAX1-LIKE 3-like [Nicotiana attenuata]|uniref:Protein smax1-like 3 n=1 Tax=Nicotiana attenuata TaxID=49451 RepID=A0A1J6IEB9_NICAT|nr:PREDICTED: protein SMAX1-LIKE 3-like [Nicotiana attenuata]OIT03246.1 protein smax1-like 3 [Nicotiana attenuata]